jgi:sulfatase maturation enzyme AslB (radical SAM superfamily)
MLNNEDVALFNVNKLKAYQNPIELIIIVVAIAISISKLENILPKQYMETPTFGDKRIKLEKLYEGLNSNRKYKMTSYNYPKNEHPKNVGKLFITISKKWIRANNEGIIIQLFIMTWPQINP